MPSSTSRSHLLREAVLDEPRRPEEGRHDLGLRLARLDDEALVRLVVLALVGREEARARCSRARRRVRARPRGRRRRRRRPAQTTGMSTAAATGRRQHEAVHGPVADVAGGLEAGRDDGVHRPPPAPSGRAGRSRRRGSGASPTPARRRSARTCAGARRRSSAPSAAPSPSGRASRSSRIARTTVLRVRLLLGDPDVDRERLVGQRDGEPDPVAHLADDASRPAPRARRPRSRAPPGRAPAARACRARLPPRSRRRAGPG